MAMKFNKTVTNFWLDTFLLLNFLVLCWASIVLRYVFPPAEKSSGWTIWGWGYNAWADMQFISLCVLAAGILLHVMLHWSWVCGVVAKWRRDRSKQAASGNKTDTGTGTLWGVGLLILICNLVGLGIAAATLSIQGPTP